MTPTDRDWIVEGAQVAELDTSYYLPQLKLTTIERLTPTQIVLANGARYNRDRLTPPGGQRGMRAPDLYPADSPKVVAALRQRRVHQMFADLETQRKARNVSPADRLAGVEALVAEARSHFDALGGRS